MRWLFTKSKTLKKKKKWRYTNTKATRHILLPIKLTWSNITMQKHFNILFPKCILPYQYLLLSFPLFLSLFTVPVFKSLEKNTLEVLLI